MNKMPAKKDKDKDKPLIKPNYGNTLDKFFNVKT
jgi:hypothetical protein